MFQRKKRFCVSKLPFSCWKIGYSTSSVFMYMHKMPNFNLLIYLLNTIVRSKNKYTVKRYTGNFNSKSFFCKPFQFCRKPQKCLKFPFCKRTFLILKSALKQLCSQNKPRNFYLEHFSVAPLNFAQNKKPPFLHI